MQADGPTLDIFDSSASGFIPNLPRSEAHFYPGAFHAWPYFSFYLQTHIHPSFSLWWTKRGMKLILAIVKKCCLGMGIFILLSKKDNRKGIMIFAHICFCVCVCVFINAIRKIIIWLTQQIFIKFCECNNWVDILWPIKFVINPIQDIHS